MIFPRVTMSDAIKIRTFDAVVGIMKQEDTPEFAKEIAIDTYFARAVRMLQELGEEQE